ncbi:hypothetical protein [Pseudochryseolinea flava]|uniref:Integron-associated effector binding protein domain-containing protein n=1 Tax=Pseudochryseolinea flava TaxID=2059302 RepID=A0A364XZT5_9BACT|nr:hypothetical protein [Pseudochryseolinea flava]RAV98998.1 hypothetical protein DQQ10_20590 [Pseudochryseolinea flava]
MEKITVQTPIQLVAKQVKTFPAGIGETFDHLANVLPHSMSRAYYGISWMEGEDIIYYAAAQQQHSEEIDQFALEPWTIESGDYLSITVLNWRSKTDSIKDVFHDLMQDKRIDDTKPCVEWYVSDYKMLCMIKLRDQ